MARRLNRALSFAVSAALVLVSIGFDAQRAAAQTFTTRAAAPASPTPQLGLGAAPISGGAPSVLAPSLLAPSLSAPSIVPAAPVPVAVAAPALAKPALAAASVAEKIHASAPALEALTKGDLTGSAASIAGRDLSDALTGERSIASKDGISAVAGAESALAPALSPSLSAASTPDAPKGPAAPAPAIEAPKTVESAASYKYHRWALKTVAALTGAVFSMPQAGAALTAKIIAFAADKQLVVSDFDDTLAAYNAVLPAEKVEAIRAIRKAGKHFAVVSDRGDVKREGSTQLTVFESLASLPNDVTEGMFVAANSGGKLYQYQNGTPVKIWEAPALEAEKLEAVKAASAATVARLHEAGVEQHPGDTLNPKESFNTYGYALMIKVGATAGQMKQVAAIMGEELAKRGIEVEVTGRLPKDLKNPGYATFSIITKTPATAKIVEKLGLSAGEVLTIGDMQYVPRKAKKESWLTRWGLKLSGLPLGEVGNETDRNMAKGVPGALALGVGRKMDPRTENGWNLAGHGPEVTQKVLEAVASKPAKPSAKAEKGAAGGEAEDKNSGWKTAGAIALFVAALGAIGLGMYAFVSALADIIAMGERLLRESMDFDREGLMLGGVLMGVAGMLGSRHAHAGHLTDPNESYAAAHKRATEIAAEAGVKAEDVRFVEATASMPVREGAQWKYSFSVPDGKGGTNLIYVDFSNFLGGSSQDLAARVYEGAAPSADAVPFAMTPALMSMGVKISPESALTALRSAHGAFGASVSVSMGVEAEPVSNDQDAWYRFYDDAGNAGKVNARTGEVRATMKAAAKPAAPAGMTHAVEPNELYVLALANIREQAAKDGVDAGRIRLLSAVHQVRTFNGAWVGDEWRFFFGWGSDSGGIEYMVPARRTMVTETMMDAFAPELRGTVSAERLAEGVDAGLFNSAVKTSPDAALKLAGGAVDRVSLLPRTEKESGDKDLWYSLQDKSGDELAVVNARTGEVRRAAPREKGSALGGFIAWLIGAARVAAVYGAMYWAFTHAPAAPGPVIPEGVPMPSNGGWQDLFGGMLGLGMAGMIGLGGVPDMLGYPTDYYADAFKAATEAAKARGVSSDRVRFAQATSQIPVFQGKHWNFTFAYEKDGATTLIYVDTQRQVAGTGMEWRVSVYEKVAAAAVPKETLRADLLPQGTRLNPELALGLVRKEHPSFGSAAGVSLELRREQGSNDGNLWYVFYDNDGGVAAVSALGGEIRLEKAGTGERKADNARTFRIVLAVIAAGLIVAALAGGLSWLGGGAGMLMLAGALKPGKGAKKPKISDDDVRASVKSVVSWKGGIWSQTEYNMGYSNALESLKTRGATKRQLELFRKLCDEAPVIGGRFNPWSGD